MRSQTSKPLPKKGAVSKATFKASSNSKQSKKKPVSPKKVKNIAKKTIAKSPKKKLSKDDITNKTDGETSGERSDSSPDIAKAGPSKSNSRSGSPTKKPKKESKEKKDLEKNCADVNMKKVIPKKSPKTGKKVNPKSSNKKSDIKNDDIKYKINIDLAKKTPSKFSKAKTIVKKGNISNQKKKLANVDKRDGPETDNVECESNNSSDKIESNEKSDNKVEIPDAIDTKDSKMETKEASTSESGTANAPSTTTADTPKIETERPPKFFTSSRTPRTVDIDVKCCKTSKGNLTVSERFLSMKLETKSEDDNKEKNAPNTLVSQGPDIDVYTFTEKVDSPKSILSDFRSPISKNVGRVRPIARVKGTIIDKKTDSEKKKYSPHRPIEEVVKQLKANKKSEELNASVTEIPTNTSNDGSAAANLEKDTEDKPKPIISKSYKMVARKSSVTGKPFSPIKFLYQEPSASKTEKSPKTASSVVLPKKAPSKPKKHQKKPSISDEEIDTSKFALSSSFQYTSSDESVNDSNDDNDTKESSGSDTPKSKKIKNKKYKRITDGAKKSNSSKELKELSKDSLVDLKDNSLLLGEKPSKRRLKLLSMWTGPKKHRMASLNAMAKVHCLYENESRTHMELGLMKTIDRQVVLGTSKPITSKKKDSKCKDSDKLVTSTSESEYESKAEKKDESSESSDDNPPPRTLRGVPGIRSAGKYWDPKSSTSSSEDSELETKRKTTTPEKKKANTKTTSAKSDTEKPPAKMKKTAGMPVKKKRNRNEVVMDLKDMVVQKRMASLNATAILAASYEKRSPKSSKDDTTSDSCSDESFSQKPKNGAGSGVKSETKSEDTKKEVDEASLTDRKQKVEVIVNQDTDVTITGVYSTHHEGFCTAMQYRISSTSHTQTTATANCEKEGCSREDGSRYTPLSALSSMQPPAEHAHNHPHPVPELGGLARRAAGCSSAFSAPSPAAHHDPGYYQPAGPLIKESGADAERALARYHPPPHYHAPHPSVLQQYGAPYYPAAELCYGRYYRPSGAYHVPPPQPDAQMVGVGNDPYPPPQYYGTPPCYQHSPQRIPYVEYRGCPCPLNACPKNVLIGPATGKAPAGGGPDVPSALAPPGGAFRAKVRACALDAVADTHGSGKDPPLESEPPAAADAPHPCPLPAIGGASPKREMYDARDLRLAGDLPGPPEPTGPPSPARGSAGACAPQPPPAAPRRARLGKAMARRSLAGDDTALLLAAPHPSTGNDADDDVLAVSPPVCAPIDLSSSDERSTPLVDVKKENEGPTNALLRKTDAQALREHNCTAVSDQNVDVAESAKAVKRRYSRPKLEIDMKDTQLEDGCRTNGIGEHVKLQKRRKVSGDQTDVRSETVTKEPKKKTSPAKRAPKTPSTEKRALKRKLESVSAGPRSKKALVETADEDPRLKNVAAVVEEPTTAKPKTKSALLLDNLIRKNSVDRPDAKGLSERNLNPAELFLPPDENAAQGCAKKTNINNNVVEGANAPVDCVRANTIAAVSQLIGKKLAYKNACKVEKIDSKITHSLKSVLQTPTVKSTEEDCPISETIDRTVAPAASEKTEAAAESADTKTIDEKSKTDAGDESQKVRATESEEERCEKEKTKRAKLANGEAKTKSADKVGKLLVSKKPAIKTDEASLVVEEACAGVGAGVRRARRRRSGLASRRPRRAPALLTPPDTEPRAPPRWSNGWSFDGEHYLSKVCLNNDSRLDRTARCWSRMSHVDGDIVARGDCVLLRPSVARAQPFVARIASLWQNPDDGEMMVSLVWYYRPEHTDSGRQPGDAPDEVYASRHRDANSVACIEDKCYVLTFNEYCRYRKRLKAAEEGITIPPSIVPPIPPGELTPSLAPADCKLPPSVSPDLVLFCRKVYDFRSKKIQVPNK